MNDGREALVETATLAVLRCSAAKRELAEALAWAAANKGPLEAQWKELNP